MGAAGGKAPRAGSLKKVLEWYAAFPRWAWSVLHAGHVEGRAGGAIERGRLSAYNHNLDTSPEFTGRLHDTRGMKTG